MSSNITGGYSEWSFDLTSEAMSAFREAMKGLAGASYEPFAFASQVVAGTNYSYLAKSRGAFPNAPLEICKIQVFAPLPNQGPAVRKDIVTIDP